MKILYHINSFDKPGGLERITIAKANWLAAHGYDVVIVTINNRGKPAFYPIDPRIRCIILGVDLLWDKSPLRKLLQRPARQRIYKRRLAEVLQQENPDIIITASVKIGKKAGKTISEFHSCRWYRLKEKGNNPLWRIAVRYFDWRKKRDAKRYDAFVCLTEEDRKDWGSDMKNCRVIPNFIKHTRTELAPLQNKQAVAVGRLVRIKRFDRLIRAWEIVGKAHPDWRLKIYGNGPLKDELKALIAEKGLAEAVELCEATTEIMSVYKESSMIISTSAIEGFHMGMLEAMSCGVPAVSVGCKCGPKVLIDHGRTGFLVPEDDTEELAKRINQLIEDDQLRKSMGERAYEKSLLFDEDAVMQQWVSLFDELAAR